MTQIRVLSAKEISQVFTVTDALEAVEDAYRQKAEGEATAWPMVYEQFEPGVADMDIRSGELAGSGLFGLKLTAWFSGNPSRGLPEVFGTTLLCDDATGAPLALLNAGAITGLRTGAAAALGVKWLARKDASRLFVVGAGHMSTFMVAATLAACPSIGHVEVWDPRKEEAPVARVELMRGEVQAILEAAARVFVDDRAQSVASGELEVPVKQGAITPEHIAAELGEVIAGKAQGRTSQDQVTVFDTSGIAAQDLAASRMAYDRAVERAMGTVVEL